MTTSHPLGSCSSFAFPVTWPFSRSISLSRLRHINQRCMQFLEMVHFFQSHKMTLHLYALRFVFPKRICLFIYFKKIQPESVNSPRSMGDLGRTVLQEALITDTRLQNFRWKAAGTQQTLAKLHKIRETQQWMLFILYLLQPHERKREYELIRAHVMKPLGVGRSIMVNMWHLQGEIKSSSI